MCEDRFHNEENYTPEPVADIEEPVTPFIWAPVSSAVHQPVEVVDNGPAMADVTLEHYSELKKACIEILDYMRANGRINKHDDFKYPGLKKISILLDYFNDSDKKV